MLAVLDCQVAGISGDMILAALIDLGANRSKVSDAIMSCPDFLAGSRITDLSFDDVSRSGFRAKALRIKYHDDVHERKGVEIYDAVARCCDSLDLDNRAKSFALASVKTIIEAEAAVHGERYSDVHLHEASSIDTLVDIVGSAVALQDLGLFSASIFSSRVAVGGGSLKFSHGLTTNPGSAVLEILRSRNFTITGGPVESELTTPTGAAMLVNLAKRSLDFYPALQPVKVGYGAGQKEFDGFPNMLKVILGMEARQMNVDTVYTLETNIDDASGEVMGSLVESLMEKGAKDVSVIPALAKKGRPAYVVKVLCDLEKVNALLEALVQESGTLGVRVQESSRYVVPRTVISVPVSVGGEDFVVRVKVVKDQEKIVYAKPEYDDVKDIAARLKIPYRTAVTLVTQAVTDKLTVLK
jgi:hypothetical protein